MSLSASTSAASPHPSNAPDTRLHGRWLRLSRVGWLAVVLFSLALFVGSLPTYYLLLQQPCVGAACNKLGASLDTAGVRALQAAGFTLGGYATYTLILTLISTFIWMGVGLVIFWRRSDDGVALLGAFTLCTGAFSNGSGQYGVIGVLAFISPVWTLPVEMSAFLGPAAGILLIGLFPHGRFVPRWVRWAVALFLTWNALSIFPPADSPLNVNNWPLVFPAVLFIGTFAALIFSHLYRYRRFATPVQRQQIKWAVFGIVLTLVLWMGVLVFEIVLTLNQASALDEAISNTLWLVTSLPIPIFFGLAILRSRLWDIDTLINKALVYGLLTALLGALYIGLIIGLESLAGALSNQAANNPVVLIISTLAIAALFLPVRRRIQALIDRRFYRKKYEAEKTLAAFSATLRNVTDLEQLREQVLAVVNETMQPTHVSLWLRQPERHPDELDHRWDQPPPVSTQPSDS